MALCPLPLGIQTHSVCASCGSVLQLQEAAGCCHHPEHKLLNAKSVVISSRNTCGSARGGRRDQDAILSATWFGSLLTMHLINEALADTPWIINEVIQLWFFPSLGKSYSLKCLWLDSTIHHNWAYFMCNFMVIIVLSHLEANQTLWTSWFINVLISINVSASHIPSESPGAVSGEPIKM